MNNRAYSLLEIKGMDDDKRIITGIASTPEPDRAGDIVDPFGAKFAAEIPLLWMHKHEKPVGTANLGKATKSGIPFRASIAKIEEPGELKNLVDYVWQAVKAGLVKGTSIGFLPKVYDILKTGGLHFKEIEVFELSLAPVPMNAGATIQTIKAFDGLTDRGAIRLIDPVADKPLDMKGAVLLSRTR